MAFAQLTTYLNRAGMWAPSSNGTLEIRPAEAVLAAALASPPPPAGARGGSLATVAEAALLQAYLSVADPGPLHWTSELIHLPPHMQRFLTQSAAIAITVQLAESYGWSAAAGHQLFWFDDLRTKAPLTLQHLLPAAKGPFPDVLCETASGWISLESRGRSPIGKMPSSTPNAEQRKRLGELDAWATAVGRGSGVLPQWAMGWTWFGQVGSRIDFFDPGDPITLSQEEEGELSRYTDELDAQQRSLVNNSSAGRKVLVYGAALDAAISTADSEDRGEVYFAGVAADSRTLTRQSDLRQRDDFDALHYRGRIYFAGRVPRSQRSQIESLVGPAIEGELA